MYFLFLLPHIRNSTAFVAKCLVVGSLARHSVDSGFEAADQHGAQWLDTDSR